MALRRNAKAKLLERVPLFSSCTRSQLDEIGKIADELDFREGKQLAREGAKGREFFVIIEGTAEVTQGRRKLRTLSDGDFFGEISLITKLPRTATVTTVSSTRALVITEQSFRRMLERQPRIRVSVRASAMRPKLASPYAPTRYGTSSSPTRPDNPNATADTTVFETRRRNTSNYTNGRCSSCTSASS